ncbi:ABC transporter ATP-binding protein/permease [Nocardioides sp. LMS-CY]|uniref:ABC transporter transmembrane domain-containing protein n=1 Tax=Nocardioides sp. (strain LMS-CY) TaxID=2840457 RepID=UPI001C00257D|nr:ABC transporter ATP-binding protein [Nocardioides sp. LMS-CY]QWF20150.1 ABC transporter ATP-binding protein/permease [Nocardioides sp. LMS-CY]
MSAEQVPATPGALIRRTVRRQRRRLLGAIALITLWQVCEAAVPVLIGVVIDRAVASGDLERLVLWCAVLCVHFAVLSFSYRFGSRIGFRAVQEEGHLLRTEVSAHVLSARGARTDRLPGDVLALATGDAELVAGVVRQLTFTVAGTAGLVISAIVLATIDPLVAVVVLVGVPVVLVCTQVLAPRLAHRAHERQEAIGRATGLATDLVRGLRPLKGIGAERVAHARYRRQSQDAMGASIAAARWEGLLYGLTSGLSLAFLAVVALVAGHRALDGGMSIGELVAVVGLAQFVAEPMGMIAYLVAQLARSRASARRILGVLAAPPLVRAGDRTAVASDLELDGVVAGTLVDVSARVARGEVVAVVAEDPSDAGTLIRLLHGEEVPDRGAVLLGGVPLTELTIAESRRLLVVAEHHVDLFEGTLRSNVDPAGRIGEERFDEVLRASSAHDLPDEPVTVNGTTLSGGQRQRLGLARALAAAAPVLVLHDPTTAVDAVTEQRIAEGIDAVRRADGATLVLTSSPALLARADRVLHLVGGRVVAVGTHVELAELDEYRAAVLR